MFYCTLADNLEARISECFQMAYFGKVYFVPWKRSEVPGKLQAIHIQRVLLYQLQRSVLPPDRMSSL